MLPLLSSLNVLSDCSFTKWLQSDTLSSGASSDFQLVLEYVNVVLCEHRCGFIGSLKAQQDNSSQREFRTEHQFLY